MTVGNMSENPLKNLKSTVDNEQEERRKLLEEFKKKRETLKKPKTSAPVASKPLQATTKFNVPSNTSTAKTKTKITSKPNPPLKKPPSEKLRSSNTKSQVENKSSTTSSIGETSKPPKPQIKKPSLSGPMGAQDVEREKAANNVSKLGKSIELSQTQKGFQILNSEQVGVESKKQEETKQEYSQPLPTASTSPTKDYLRNAPKTPRRFLNVPKTPSSLRHEIFPDTPSTGDIDISEDTENESRLSDFSFSSLDTTNVSVLGVHETHSLLAPIIESPKLPILDSVSENITQKFIASQILSKPVIIQVIGKNNEIKSSRVVKPPPMNLFTIKNAHRAEKASQVDVARAIYGILSCPKASLGKWKSSLKSAKLWVHWARFEERQGDFERAVELYEHAERNGAQPMELIAKGFKELMLRMALARMGKEPVKIGEEEEEEEELDDEETPKMKAKRFFNYRDPGEHHILSDEEDSFAPTPGLEEPMTPLPSSEPRLHPPHSLVATPTPRRPALMNEIASILNDLTLNDEEPQSQSPLSKDEKPDSSIAMLTPVRASKKYRQELGVTSVITPVRRSTRHMTEIEDLDFEELLKAHGYAYVPNEALSDRFKIVTPQKKSTSKTNPLVTTEEKDHPQSDNSP